MRIRRKKRFEERFKNVSDLVIVAERDIANPLIAIQDKKYLDYEKIFGNNNQVDLEVGCGKGSFIIECAKQNPNINYIAVELLNNIILMALEQAKKYNLKNLIFLNSGAEYLARYIKPKTITNIYLNFSPPFPKKGEEGKRLTTDRMVKFYKDFLTDDGIIFQKTDDVNFFNYSMEIFKNNGFSVEDRTSSDGSLLFEKVITEYENKFRSQNIQINRLIAKK